MSSVLLGSLVSDRFEFEEQKQKALGFSVSLRWLHVPQPRRTKTALNVEDVTLLVGMIQRTVKEINSTFWETNLFTFMLSVR